jgi:hypothetical protein
MASRILIPIGVALLLSGGVALAQPEDQPANSFFADPVLPDPPMRPLHVIPPSVATSDVAEPTPAAGSTASVGPLSACTALSPCAIPTPAARR